MDKRICEFYYNLFLLFNEINRNKVPSTLISIFLLSSLVQRLGSFNSFYNLINPIKRYSETFRKQS